MSEEEKSKSFEKIVMPTSKGRAEVTSIDYVLNQVFNDSGTKRSWDRSVRVKESEKLMKQKDRADSESEEPISESDEEEREIILNSRIVNIQAKKYLSRGDIVIIRYILDERKEELW